MESDEELQGYATDNRCVCSDISWIIESKAKRRSAMTSTTYVANRSGAFSEYSDGDSDKGNAPDSKRHLNAAASCVLRRTRAADGSVNEDKFDDDYAPDDENFAEPVLGRLGSSLGRTRQVMRASCKMLLLTAVAFARDRSRYYDADGGDLENWGSASAEFTLDTCVELT